MLVIKLILKILLWGLIIIALQGCIKRHFNHTNPLSPDTLWTTIQEAFRQGDYCEALRLNKTFQSTITKNDSLLVEARLLECELLLELEKMDGNGGTIKFFEQSSFCF